MKNKQLKTVTAGRLVYAVCYTRAMGSADDPKRAPKNKCSTLGRQVLNFRASWQKLRLLLCCNFDRGDLWVTVGYDDDHLPPNRKAAKAQAQKFIDRMRKARKLTGDELRYVYNTEELQADGSRRLHHHMVINAGSARKDFELIRSMWTGGDNIEIRELGKHEMYSDDFLELAQYMAKERNPEAKTYAVGDKAWQSSRNLRKVKSASSLVEDYVTVSAPPGARILDTDHKSNEYGSYDYIVYLLPVTVPDARKRRKKAKKE